MPQGTIQAVRPDPLSPEYEWIKNLIEFIKKNYGIDMKIGVIETCELEDGDTSINRQDKLLFIIPEADFPDGILEGSCDTPKATRVKFKIEKKPFKYAYDVKKV
ncbi:hypothetical protein I2I11_17520 [Pontibacter sp. 172403-2]|uniref:hypothetical protein n=1 Tax=Pontibacter rufus TaxID=2791028 RepID=UPI0018AF5950|nr:hypothetical protein [Pontibacter sp. 172403-2]MBF9255102.1 hypothetical protein [Pontibacter sp. 172403-2]